MSVVKGAKERRYGDTSTLRVQDETIYQGLHMGSARSDSLFREAEAHPLEVE